MIKLLSIICCLLGVKLSVHSSPTSTNLIQSLVAIKSQGEGNQEAMKAWPLVSNFPPSAIPPLLDAMNRANNLGDNWIRAAIEKICEQNATQLPIEKIIVFLQDYSNEGDAREMAFQILQSEQPSKANQLIPSFINDPAPVLRQKAVELILNKAKNSSTKPKAILLYHRALMQAREVEQIKEASRELEEAGEKINLIQLMGLLPEWQLMGPFDNSERKGFSIEYGPESEKGLTEQHKNKDGIVKWEKFSTQDELGLVDINQKYGELKEVCAYAKTTFHSESAQSAHFRIGSKNAWKMWVNGALLFSRDEYHRGKTRIDQFIIEGKLKEGENEILLKVCQNEQTQSWTKQWEFNFRITDRTGSAIHSNGSIIK
jgi:hypothetical protein